MLQISLSMMRTFGEEKYDYQKYSGSHMIVNGIKIVLKDFPRKKGFFSKNFQYFLIQLVFPLCQNAFCDQKNEYWMYSGLHMILNNAKLMIILNFFMAFFDNRKDSP